MPQDRSLIGTYPLSNASVAWPKLCFSYVAIDVDQAKITQRSKVECNL